MSKRTKTGQKKHDSNVLKWAKQKEKEGFKVTADLPGWKKPPKIEGGVPDGYAKKGKEKKMFEVETHDTLETDKKQRAKFRKWAKQSKNRTFYTKVVKK